MNPTVLTFLILAAYFTVAAISWRPFTRRIYIDIRQESLQSSWSRKAWNPAAARRMAGAIGVCFAVIWPISMLSFGLMVVVPPVFRRVMDKATAGIGGDDVDSSEGDDRDPAAAFDDLDPVDAVVMAWTIPDGSKYRHEANMREVAEAMPALAHALERLTKSHADSDQ
jgi:hypothetical protein